MSKSDAQRRSYLADQMTMGERVEALERRLGGLESDVLEVDADDIQYFHDELRSLGRRIADLELSGTTRKASPTECGRIVVDASEWDRLQRIEEAAMKVNVWDPFLCLRDPRGEDNEFVCDLIALEQALKS